MLTWHEIPPTAGLPLRLSDLRFGPDRLCETLAQQLGTPGLQLECSGTACLMLALHTLRQEQPARDEVVVGAYTCPLVAIAVHRLGLKLRVCDTRPGHWDLDPDHLHSLCSEKTLAIVATHLGGQVAALEKPLAMARACGAFLIEDAAQALGATVQGQSVGLQGDLGFFSLAAGKGLSIYEGGLLLTRHEALRQRLRQSSMSFIPRHRSMEARRSLELLGLALLYRPLGLRLAYGWPLRRALRRGDPVAAVGDDFPLQVPLHPVGRWRRGVGTRAAARLPLFLQANRKRALARLQQLNTIPGVTALTEAPGTQASWPFIMLLLDRAERAEAALQQLWTAGLGVSRLLIHALPDYAYLRGVVPPGKADHARDFAARMITLSNSAWLDEAAFARILRQLRRSATT